MEEALRFFRTYEMWMYVILALAGLVYIRKFILAWEDLRKAAFGLERESAQSSLNQSAGMLVLLFVMGVGIFVLVSFVAPSFPASNPLLTPTMDLLASPTTTLLAEGTDQNNATPTVEDLSLTPTIAVVGEGCVPGQIMLTEPVDGSEISDVIVVKGTANIQNFGFYKYELARPGEPVWLTIQAGRDIIQDGDLGQWDTRTLAPGDYMLRLVVTDNQGESLEPCVIRVFVNNPSAP
ncbi:MAG: hypothetical protein JSV69_08045 [Chloroflexota bacterium]|nr:MAG: hypothetical protein JSV69_08045 [Chloroflexota bacterium]UCF28779.1 MAG: hypothetical protein JSW42_03585 [Chloroflexota bacterium]